MDRLKEWRCCTSDEYGSPENRAIYDTLSRTLMSLVSTNF
jgi:hypothetical protein